MRAFMESEAGIKQKTSSCPKNRTYCFKLPILHLIFLFRSGAGTRKPEIVTEIVDRTLLHSSDVKSDVRLKIVNCPISVRVEFLLKTDKDAWCGFASVRK